MPFDSDRSDLDLDSKNRKQTEEEWEALLQANSETETRKKVKAKSSLSDVFIDEEKAEPATPTAIEQHADFGWAVPLKNKKKKDKKNAARDRRQPVIFTPPAPNSEEFLLTHVEAEEQDEGERGVEAKKQSEKQSPENTEKVRIPGEPNNLGFAEPHPAHPSQIKVEEEDPWAFARKKRKKKTKAQEDFDRLAESPSPPPPEDRKNAEAFAEPAWEGVGLGLDGLNAEDFPNDFHPPEKAVNKTVEHWNDHGIGGEQSARRWLPQRDANRISTQRPPSEPSKHFKASSSDLVSVPNAPSSQSTIARDTTLQKDELLDVGSARHAQELPLRQRSELPTRSRWRPGHAEPTVASDEFESQTSLQQRRESYTKQSPRQRFEEPAQPPHMPQPHFYGLPGPAFNFAYKGEARPGKPAGTEGYCCCFDSIADCGDAASSRKAKDALLVGSEGGLDVFRVLPGKCEVVGRLEGLRGSVIQAKILPHAGSQDDMRHLRPLVAVVLHGPCVGDGRDINNREPRAQYQTTVEVYSLQTQQHVTTLYKSASIAFEQLRPGQLSSVPEPIGDLILAAEGEFLTVASGASGEIFVFSAAPTPRQPESTFRCIGKYWTTLQCSLESARPRSLSETVRDVEDSRPSRRVPLLSLSPRWLALVSPSCASHVFIQGSPLLSNHNPQPPALGSHVAPPPPTITCELAGVDLEDAWSRLTRQAAKGVVKYSQRGIDLGWQGWKELTHPSAQSASQRTRTSSKDSDLFPPTKALPEDPKRLDSEPAIISIVDLEQLLVAEETRAKHQALPMATFALIDGCNFLSFCTSGLSLLTVSRTGDHMTIWDLSQASHGIDKRDSRSDASVTTAPCVKLIHRIARSSQSVVIDSAWSREDDWLAVLTTHGTVHLHEVPLLPEARKRTRQSTSSKGTSTEAEAVISVQEELSPPSRNAGFLGRVRTGLQQIGTQVNTIRTQNPVTSLGIPTTFAGFRDATATAGQASTRVLAKGLSQGLSAAKGGASDYWHSEDNKIRHKALQDAGGSRSIRWIRRQSEAALAITCGGQVHMHPVQRTERRKGEALISGLKHDKYGKKTFALPSIRTRDPTIDPRSSKKADECSSVGPHGFWSLRSSPEGYGRITSMQHRARPNTPSRSSQAANEVETNPPYCPFHIDARVDVCAFDEDDSRAVEHHEEEQSISLNTLRRQGQGGKINSSSKTWLFGPYLPPSTKMNTHEHLQPNAKSGYQGAVGDWSDDDEAAMAQVQSTITVLAESEGERGEIRVRSSRVVRDGGRGDEDGDDDRDEGDDDGFAAVEL